MTQMAKLTSKGQITLPKAIRDRLNLDKGSCIAIYLEKGNLVMKKVNPRKPLSDEDSIQDIVGVFHDGYENESLQELKTQCKVTSIKEASKWRQSR